MPTQTERMDTIIETLLDRVDDALLNPKPTYRVNDQEFQWTEYIDMLFNSLDKAYELRAKLAGPIMKSSIMRAI
jgi:hypothetical protein